MASRTSKPRIDSITRHPDRDPGNRFYDWLQRKLGLPPLDSFGPTALLEGMRVEPNAHDTHPMVIWKTAHPAIAAGIEVRITFAPSSGYFEAINFMGGGISYEQAAAFVADYPREAWEGAVLEWNEDIRSGAASEWSSKSLTIKEVLS